MFIAVHLRSANPQPLEVSSSPQNVKIRLISVKRPKRRELRSETAANPNGQKRRCSCGRQRQFLPISRVFFLQISKFPAAFFPDFQGVFPSTGLDVEICEYLVSPGQGRNMDRSQGGKEIKARGMVNSTMRVGNLGRVGIKIWVLSVSGWLGAEIVSGGRHGGLLGPELGLTQRSS